MSTYNYQNIINNFNEPFYQNKGFRSKKYLEYSNSQMIIDFFNFNRSISSIIINDLHTIEMRLSSAISYEIMNITKYPYFNEEYINTIFDCTDDEFDYLNTNLNQILEQRKKNNSKD
ncbi:Abi family protein [bacterium]|nr:Abi family protein [bacterium]